MNAVTDKELDAFYGTEPTEAEVAYAIRRQNDAFDIDDLVDITESNGLVLLAALKDGAAERFFNVFQACRKDSIARRASFELFGRPGVITVSEVA